MNVNCKFCGKEFQTSPYIINIGKGKYCSHSCAAKNTLPHATMDRNVLYKGEEAKRNKKLEFYRRHFSNANKCLNKGCSGNSSHFLWVFIDGESREISNISHLCKSCSSSRAVYQMQPDWDNELLDKLHAEMKEKIECLKAMK